ncbi:HNH endonuclease [Mucilaginibacter sp. OK098]|uniref:HNH endonuclease n=1 Tax=Mucilaginibacter sp. OK098 TaxID=1855297 RepID=UPI00092144B5|nr:HNH endonuclease [Mucilaginibacter sp. OK098]SHM93537.1 hypothetical protein SAMN05216524_104176 [Mucilaginibacter sp. OK098]
MRLSFLALSCSKDLQFGNPETESTISFLYELSIIMSESVSDKDGLPSVLIKTWHSNTQELRDKIDALIVKYSSINIKIMQLRGYFQQLAEGEYFAFCRTSDLTEELSKEYSLKLLALRDGQSLEVVKEQHEQSLGNLLQRYQAKGKATHFNQRIGEPDKSKRICRFCKRSMPDVSFKNVAHAIAEALGNKTLILNEECDTCNAEFGSDTGIEKNLITFLKPFITVFGLTGKRGVPKLRGDGFDLEYSNPSKRERLIEEELNQVEQNAESSSDQEEEFFDGKFAGTYKGELVWQDLYRTLVKYVLSIMDHSELKGLDKTIQWINREFTATSLPKIAILQNLTFFSKQPRILYYHRKDDNANLPYIVAEFHQTMFTFVFIIPFAEQDELDFTLSEDYSRFWNYFKHFSVVKGWRFQNPSDNTPSEHKVNLSFKQRVKEESDGKDQA